MARFLSHKDGRLRTGRVAFLVFMGVMVCLGGVFQLSKPINETVVRVKHVFEPQEEVPVEKEKTAPQVEEKTLVAENKKEENTNSAEDTPDKTEKSPEIIPEESKTAEAPAEKVYKNPEPGVDKPVEDSITDKDKKEEEQVAEATQEKVEADSTVQHQENQNTSGEDYFEENTTTDIVRENVVNEQKPEITRKEEAFKEEKVNIQSTKLADTGIMKLKESFSNENSEVKEPTEKMLSENLNLNTENKEEITEKVNDIDITGKLGKFLNEDQKENEVNTENKLNNLVRNDSNINRPVADSDTSITVEKGEYMKLLKGWQSTGKQFDGDTKIPLSVENLENVYDLFQMKPVAVTGQKFIDLKDGAVIQEDALLQYSSTVFEVDSPWEKWGTALKKAGVKQGRRVDVRYYMYGFIRNAIYSRVNQCFTCMKSKGLIPAVTKPDEIDVLGRVYAVKRKGGGSFGVFVPLTIFTKNGQTVSVDSACFDGQPDIEALKAAGVL